MVWLQGEQLALRIYLDAVASDRFTWRIPGIPVPSGAEGMPQPALAPVGPAVQTPLTGFPEPVTCITWCVQSAWQHPGLRAG